MSLEGKQIRNTYRGLAILNDTNSELTTSLQTIKDGAGNESALKISTDKVGISDYVFPQTDGAANQVLATDGSGQLSWANTSVIDWGNFNNDIIPALPNFYKLGTSAMPWKDVFVGPGSLYVNGKQVLSDDSGTIVVSTSDNQNLSIKTKGTGNLELAAEGTGALTFKSDVAIQNGSSIRSTTSAVSFESHLNLNSYRIANLAAPINPNDAARKADVDAITLAYTPLNKAGDSMAGELAMGGNKITGLGEPTTGTDATTKNYVDNAVAGLKWKDPVKAATITNITLNSNTIIDGVSVTAGDRVLVKNQTDATQNGIYVVVGAGGWTRATDADNNPGAEIGGGTAVFVQNGNVNGGVGYVITSPAGVANLGTDPIVWAAFTGADALTAGDGLSVSGNELSVDGTVVRTTTFNGLGDARYLQLSGGILTGELQINRAASNQIRMINGSDNIWFGPSTGSLAFVVNSENAARIDPPGLSLTHGISVVTREKGDARYPQLAATNTFAATQNATIWSANDGGVGTPTFRFTNQIGTGFSRAAASNTIQVSLSSVAVARFEPTGVSTTDGITLITREKGDARYPQLGATSNVFTGIQWIRNTSPIVIFEDTDATLNNKKAYLQAVSGKFIVGVWNDDDTFKDVLGSFEAGTSITQDYTVITREKGDARYVRTDQIASIGNTLTLNDDNQSFIISNTTDTTTGLLDVSVQGNATDAIIRFHRDTNVGGSAKTYFYIGNSTTAIEAMIVGGDGTTAPHEKTVITREKGDARYPTLFSNNTFTGQQIIQSTNPIFEIWDADGGTDEKRWYFSLGNNVLTINRKTDAGVYTEQPARIDPVGTTAPSVTTIITRQKGDARYTQISSDMALKENIQDAPEALPIIEQLRPVQFTWKDTEEEGDLTHIGLLAQEVAEVIPSAVREAGNGLGLEMRDLIGLLVKSVKELSAEVKKLKGE